MASKKWYWIDRETKSGLSKPPMPFSTRKEAAEFIKNYKKSKGTDKLRLKGWG